MSLHPLRQPSPVSSQPSTLPLHTILTYPSSYQSMRQPFMTVFSHGRFSASRRQIPLDLLEHSCYNGSYKLLLMRFCREPSAHSPTHAPRRLDSRPACPA